MQKINKTALVWFRNDLRTQDHQNLAEATEKYESVVAYYSFDPRLFEDTDWGFKKTEKYRAQFLIDTIVDLEKQLSTLNIPLYTDRKYPEESIPLMVASFDIKALYFQEEWTEEEAEVAASVISQIDQTVTIVRRKEQFLFHPDDFSFTIDETPNVFTAFRKKCEKESHVRSLFHRLKHAKNKNIGPFPPLFPP